MKQSEIRYATYLNLSKTDIFKEGLYAPMVKHIEWYEDIHPALYFKTNNIIKIYRDETLVS